MIGFSSPNFSLVPIETVVPMVAEHFKLFEFYAEGLHRLPDMREKLNSLLPSYELCIQVHAPLSDINIASFNPSIRVAALSEILASIETAAELGFRLVTLHPGYLSPLSMNAKQKVLELTKHSLIMLARAAENCNIVLALENMPNLSIAIGMTPQELGELIAETEIKLCFDIGHANTTAQIDAFLPFVDLFTNIHLHDNNGKRDQHAAIGEGNIDFRHFFEHVKARYKGDYILEMKSFEGGLKSKSVVQRLLA